MGNKGEIPEIAKEIHNELQLTANALYKELFSGFPDAKELPKGQYLEHVRQNWSDPQFRRDLLTRVGPINFMNTAYEALGVMKPKAPGVEDIVDEVIQGV